jgi:hypothetical protein
VPARGARPYDVDGDGRQEIAVGLPDLGRTGGRPAGTVVVLRQRGPRLGWERFAAARWRLPGAPRSATTTFGRALASGDFDGDGHADLAVGAAGADLSRGAVLVRYGSRAGLTPGRQRRFSGPAGFGAALAAGDLDRDGYADLVAGVTGDQTNVEEDYGSGSLRIYFGGPSGLTASRRRTIARPRRLDAAFGAKIALGDVDGDDRPDIAEGAPGSPSTEEFGPLPGHAAYCPGGPRGARSCRPMGTEGASGPTALAVGDVTDHQHADIVQGVAVSKRGDELLPVPGQIRLWRGRDGGPAPRPLVITQSTPGVRGSDDPGDRFGAEVAVADLDRDSQGDVVVGVPGEDAGTGRVVVVFGSPRGLSPLPGDLLQEAPPGVRQPGDRFGSGLALMDTTGDNRPELVVSAPGDRGGAGTLSVFRGAGRSFDPARPQVVVLSRFGRGYLRGRTGRVYLGRRNSS